MSLLCPLVHTAMFDPQPFPPSPGTGRTGYLAVPPNNYPFYNDDEKYVPVMQADGGQLSGGGEEEEREGALIPAAAASFAAAPCRVGRRWWDTSGWVPGAIPVGLWLQGSWYSAPQ